MIGCCSGGIGTGAAVAPIQWGSFGAGIIVNAANFLDPWYGADNTNASGTSAALVCRFRQRWFDMEVHHNNPIADANVVYTIQRNGVPTTLTITIASGASDASVVASEDFEIGDTIECTADGTLLLANRALRTTANFNVIAL